MKRWLFAGALLGALIAAPTHEAEARLKCPLGKIARPSLGICQTYKAAERSGVRVKRYSSRAKVRHVRAYQRPRVARDARPQEAAVTLRERATLTGPAITPEIQGEIALRAWLTEERRAAEIRRWCRDC